MRSWSLFDLRHIDHAKKEMKREIRTEDEPAREDKKEAGQEIDRNVY
jgi:hypothetical protein